MKFFRIKMTGIDLKNRLCLIMNIIIITSIVISVVTISELKDDKIFSMKYDVSLPLMIEFIILFIYIIANGKAFKNENDLSALCAVGCGMVVIALLDFMPDVITVEYQVTKILNAAAVDSYVTALIVSIMAAFVKLFILAITKSYIKNVIEMP